MKQVSVQPTIDTERVNEYRLPTKEPSLNPATPASTQVNGSASTYWISGAIALMVGLAVFGIPCSLLAIHLGGKAIERGASTAGKLVRWAGWVELVLTVLFILATA